MTDLSKDEIIESLVSCLCGISGCAQIKFLSEQYPDPNIRPRPLGWSALSVYREATKVLNKTGFSDRVVSPEFMSALERLWNVRGRPPTLSEVHNQMRFVSASLAAKQILKHGDRIRVTKCPGTKRTITFECWDGNWIVSKSGMADYSATTIDRVNGVPVAFE